MAASPLRRAVQLACLLAFLLILFYVCQAGPPTALPQRVSPATTASVEPTAPSDQLPQPDYAASRAARERIPLYTFLALDPLVSISTAIAGRVWVWSLAWAGVLLVVSLLIPRAFCGYLCPLGTLIDAFDWLAGRVRRRNSGPPPSPWFRGFKYYLLSGVLACSLLGVLTGGFVAAIPLVTRGLAYALGQSPEGGLATPIGAGPWVSIALLAVVLCLGLIRPRFWCRYICPSGAVFSLVARVAANKRRVTKACIACGQCVKACPFDAIHDDFSTRGGECAHCQVCGGVCPVGAIEFGAGRSSEPRLQGSGSAPTARSRSRLALSRRGFLAGTVSVLAAGAVVPKLLGDRTSSAASPVRPPGSVPEKKFRDLCIRCGACVKACPTGLLQPSWMEQGLDGLWTPRALADRAVCAPNCNNCGRACPTGAIRAMSVQEKKATRMGLAAVNRQTCLVHARRKECFLCAEACESAGYNAIEPELVTFPDGQSNPAPVVNRAKCVGCGACQATCFAANVRKEPLLETSAIVVEAGEGKEDRRLQ